MTQPTFSLAGKTAIVTGGRRGIGKAIALGFARAGADVAIADIILEDGELQAVAGEIQKVGRRSLALRVDTTNRTDIDKMVQTVVDEFGRIDILVNNAGVLKLSLLLNLKDEDWDKTIDTDLKGYFMCCQAVGRQMVEQKSGNIINIASDQTMKALPMMGVYSIAKEGVVMLTRVLAVELARYNIRVNAISPALTRTALSEFAWQDPEILKRHAAQRPLGRIAEPADIVGAAIFLASAAASYITGSNIRIDGGLHA